MRYLRVLLVPYYLVRMAWVRHRLRQLEHCGYCGDLGWTEREHGRLTHKHTCPHRVEPYCQTHPAGCPACAA